MRLYINIYVTRNQQSYHKDIFNTENSQKVLKIAIFGYFGIVEIYVMYSFIIWLYINISVTKKQQSYHMDIFNTEKSQKVLKIAIFGYFRIAEIYGLFVRSFGIL